MSKFRTLLFYLILLILVAIIIFPFFWMVLASFKTHVQIMDLGRIWIFTPTIANYYNVFAQYNFLTPLLNSSWIAFMSTVLGLLIGVPAAYAIAKFRKQAFATVILVSRIIPGLTFLVPWFILFTSLNLVDTYSSLVATHLLVGLPLIVWIMIPYFEAFPRELENAARVDGCNNYMSFWFIVLPLTGPSIITASILSVIYSWNNFMFSLVLAGYHTKTLPIAIFNFIEYAEINWGGLMAASVIITVPIIAISLFLQKYIVKGLMSGSIKG